MYIDFISDGCSQSCLLSLDNQYERKKVTETVLIAECHHFLFAVSSDLATELIDVCSVVNSKNTVPFLQDNNATVRIFNFN